MTAMEPVLRELRATRYGRTWMARCPAHHDRTPSLSIGLSASGKVLFHCFAGCPQSDVIAALRSMGLWQQPSVILHSADPPKPGSVGAAEESQPHPGAMAIWNASETAQGTPAERYLRSRGIDIPAPRTLRFHSGLRHPDDQRWPAMVALVARGSTGEPIAVHRTFLARDGSGKAPVTPQKMMLGRCRGGAVRLAQANDTLMVGEGIETCLSVMQATGNPAWAALSTSGLRALDLPDSVREVIVLADGDDPGEAAAEHCAARWRREGRKVRIARPPRGMDFNDARLLEEHGQ